MFKSHGAAWVCEGSCWSELACVWLLMSAHGSIAELSELSGMEEEQRDEKEMKSQCSVTPDLRSDIINTTTTSTTTILSREGTDSRSDILMYITNEA